MKRIFLLTREDEQNKLDQATRFKGIDAEFISLPLIEYHYEFNWDLEKISKLSAFEWLFFTSQHGIRAFFATLSTVLSASELQELLKDKRFAVIGEKSRKTLAGYGYSADFMPQNAAKKNLMLEWHQRFSDTQKLWIIGDQVTARPTDTDTYWQMYQNICLPKQQRLLTELLKQRQVTDYFVSSPSIWHRFYESYRLFLTPMQFYCLGKTTAAAIMGDLGTCRLSVIK